MMILIVDLKTVHEGWAKYSVGEFRLDNGETVKREIEDHGRAAAVLPYDEKRKTAILVRQFRAPVFVTEGDEDSLEAIAGLVEEDDPEETGGREAHEEAGLRLRKLERVAEVWSMPGLSTERMSLFLAPYDARDRETAGGGVAGEEENITVEEIPLAELARRADAGELRDMKAFVLIQTLRLRRPDLFEG
jgi:nudix-type nucleoside diphosphatase (YffH/AdpP family)